MTMTMMTKNIRENDLSWDKLEESHFDQEESKIVSSE